jgi:hypothetical protein
MKMTARLFGPMKKMAMSSRKRVESPVQAASKRMRVGKVRKRRMKEIQSGSADCCGLPSP